VKIPFFLYQKEKDRIIIVWVWNIIKKYLQIKQFMMCLKFQFLKLLIFNNTAFWNKTPRSAEYRPQSTLEKTIGSSEKLKPIYQNTVQKAVTFNYIC
jgi:hypothetical protein